MPQVSTSAQLSFTNHWIGIYAKDNSLVPARHVTGLRPLPATKPLTGKFLPPGDPSALRPIFERALADREKELGLQHPKTARSAADLGLFLISVGDQADAETSYGRAIKLDETNSEAMLAADQEILASVLADVGKREEAVELFRLAAEHADPAVAARCYSRLAVLDADRAETYLQSALKAEETASGKNHARVAQILNDLALALGKRNDLRSAEPLFLRALAIERRAHGSDSFLTAMLQSNLGHLLQGAGQLDEAERLQREALAIFEKKAGPDSKQLATAYTTLADVLWSKGDRISAGNLFRFGRYRLIRPCSDRSIPRLRPTWRILVLF